MVAAEGLVCISRTFDADRLDVLLGIAIVVDVISRRNVHVCNTVKFLDSGAILKSGLFYSQR